MNKAPIKHLFHIRRASTHAFTLAQGTDQVARLILSEIVLSSTAQCGLVRSPETGRGETGSGTGAFG